MSLPRSHAAALRETQTTHSYEYLGNTQKGIFSITNYLGGEYYLTADEIYHEDNLLVIQESKNSSTGKIPSEDDIKDGLFKLILFANMESLFLGDTEVDFMVRLKITGDLIGSLSLPSDPHDINAFCLNNSVNQRQKRIITSLNQEAIKNSKLQILITNRHE